MTPQAFLQAICDSPDDDVPRLVYADYLEERGDPPGVARAEFIRAQCELAKMDEADDRRWDLDARCRQLLWQYGKHWAGPLRRLVRRWQFRRGFVEEVTLPAAEFFRHAETIFRLAPIRGVRFLAVGVSDLSRLARSPWLARLSGLDFRHQAIDPAAFAPLTHTRRLAGVRELNLRGTGLCCDEGARLLADCRHLRGLTTLDLGDRKGAALGSAGIRALSESPHLSRLTRLRLAGHGRGGREVVDALAGTPLLGRLEELDLSRNYLYSARSYMHQEAEIDRLLLSPQVARLRVLRLNRVPLGDAVATLAESPHLIRLALLEICGIYLGDGYRPGLSSLVRSPHLTGLVALNLAGGKIGKPGWSALAAAPLPRLRELNLSETRIDTRNLQALAKGPLLGHLQVLRLQGTGFTHSVKQGRVSDAGVRALARSRKAAELRQLDLGNQEVGDAGARALADSPHLGKLTSLYLWRTRVGDAGAIALVRSKRLAALAALDLRSNDLSAATRKRLRRRFGPGARYGPGPTDISRRSDLPDYLLDDEEPGAEGDIPF